MGPIDTTGTVQGALSALMQGYDPQERQLALAAREAAYNRFQELAAQPVPDQGPVMRGAGNYMRYQSMNPLGGFWNLARAIGEEGEGWEQKELANQNRQLEAAKFEALRREGDVKEADNFVGKLSTGVKAASSGANKPTVKMDKDGNMVVYDPVTDSTRIVHASQRGEFTNLFKLFYQNYTDEKMPNAEQKALEAAFSVMKQQPSFNPMVGEQTPQPGVAKGIAAPGQTQLAGQQTTPAPTGKRAVTLPPDAKDEQIAAVTAAFTAAENVLADPSQYSPEQVQKAKLAMAALQKAYPNSAGTEAVLATGGQQAALAVGGNKAAYGGPTIQYKDPAREAYDKAQAEGAGKALSADVTNIINKGNAAKDSLDMIRVLHQIDPNTGAFADVQEQLGKAFEAFGVDPNSPIIQDAIKNRNANVILSQFSNAKLRAEKGVQTQGDEIRIKKEFAQTKDPKATWNFVLRLSEEKLNREQERGAFVQDWAEANGGRHSGAIKTWDNDYENDPLTQRIGGKMVFRSQYINAFVNGKHGSKDEAIESWREYERQARSRGWRY